MNPIQYALIDLSGGGYVKMCHFTWPHPTNGMEQWSRILPNLHVFKGSRISKKVQSALIGYDALLVQVRNANVLSTLCAMRKQFPVSKIVMVPYHSTSEYCPKLFEAISVVDGIAVTDVSEMDVWETLAPGKCFWLGFPIDFEIYERNSRSVHLRDRNTVLLDDCQEILVHAKMLQNVCGPLRFLVRPQCHQPETLRTKFSLAGMTCEVVVKEPLEQCLRDSEEAIVAFSWSGTPAFQIDCAAQRIPCVGVDFGYQPILFPEMSYHVIRGHKFALEHVNRFIVSSNGPEYENVTTRAFKYAVWMFHPTVCVVRWERFQGFLFQGEKPIRGPEWK
ncbi:MAG TPA: hypothetical protein PLY86_17220 [bacterium]|nr:hypothetical protein [bacterium]